MDIKRKLEIVEKSVQSISQHGDEDAAVRNAALDAIVSLIERERTAIAAEVQARVESQVG